MNIVLTWKGRKYWITVILDIGHPGDTSGSTPGCIFPCFSARKAPWIYFVHLYAPCDNITTKTTPPGGRTHPGYIVSNSEVNWTDGSQDTAIFVSPLSYNLPNLTIISTWDMASELTPMPQLITQSVQATADAIASALTARTASISLPAYDWNSQDAYHSSIFCCTLENWLLLNYIPPDSKDHLRYVFAALGTKSLEMHAQWMPTSSKEEQKATKAKASAFLDHIQQGMTHNGNTHVYLGELDDIVARLGEDPQDLVACIKTLMDQCKMINDEHREHKLCCHIICAYCHEGKLLGKLMAKPFKTPSSELAEIAVNHFAIQHAREQVSHSSKPVDTICQDKGQTAHTSHNSNGHTPSALSKDCPNYTQQHPAGRSNCPAHDSHCSKCDKMGHWGPKCHGGKPLLTRNTPPPGSKQRKSRCPPRNHSHCQGQNNKTDTIDVNKDHSPQHKIALHYIQPNPTIWNTQPEEIMVWDVCTPQCTEAYTTIQLPASASRKGTASLHVKVDTGAGGNVLPLCVFQCLYPDQISPAGLPTGLDHISTRLTAYNRSHIPLYGALHGPITWQPDHSGSCPHRVKSYWYVADTPGPAILGLPSSEKLAVMKMNCAITVRQPGTHPAPVSTTVAMNKPATAPEAAKPIRSTDDLIKEFPCWFQGIGRFSSKYKMWLCHDAHPVIHAPRKCPIALHPKVKEHLDKMECLGVITHVDEPMDWVSSITYIQKANSKLCLCLDPHNVNKAIRHDHHKMPTVEEVAHKFAHSCFFTKLDAHHGYWSIVLDQDSSLLTTFNSPFSRYCFLWLPFGLVCSQDIFQKKMDQILEECQGCIRIADDITVHGHTKAEHDVRLWDLMQIACKYDLVFNPQKTHMKAQAVNFFGCFYDANGVHPGPGKVNAVHALPAPTNVTELQEFLGLVTYLSPFIPGLATLTAPLWELLKKDTDFSWNLPMTLLLSRSRSCH